MSLFPEFINPTKNILPFDGCVLYYGKIFSTEETLEFYSKLLNDISWQHDEALIFGKLITTKRKVAWYGDDTSPYTYSKRTKVAKQWTPELLEIKKNIEKISQESFNSCLLNLYHDGAEGMAWHSDAEREMKKNAAIASVSFGAERKFSFKHKTSGETVSLTLESGSLLIMKDETQQHWLHRLPPSKKIATPRINLTFRTYVSESLTAKNQEIK
ncbi:alpha-ketoglutarate-dependent dioxygenase AlkB family protein [Chryseobacterium sp. POL2]|uniref:alpha-ketoglutarate-dependent dioxygenase AlkB family protein n=1 Tax=Chryseobacterium sp. POL2 TaxID=2713414 RepID=UPI0016258C98|nr:alpha-ketoglutarate-dependent dioxygenase AlkB [Chryseobacterium sp. POL2]